MKTILTFGTYDLFHVGHLRLLERARALGDRLIVGVSTDELNLAKKGIAPVFPLSSRMEIIRSLSCVDDVFAEESLELKADYIKAAKADVLVMGNDWDGKFDIYSTLCEVVYFPRTLNISTTLIKKTLSTFDPSSLSPKWPNEKAEDQASRAVPTLDDARLTNQVNSSNVSL